MYYLIEVPSNRGYGREVIPFHMIGEYEADDKRSWATIYMRGINNMYYERQFETNERMLEVYKQLQDWMTEIYKCSINKYYLKIFADMGGDIIFRFPEE